MFWDVELCFDDDRIFNRGIKSIYMGGQNFPVLCPGVLGPILGTAFEEGQSEPGERGEENEQNFKGIGKGII